MAGRPMPVCRCTRCLVRPAATARPRTPVAVVSDNDPFAEHLPGIL
jgi:hypothetical protein